MLERLLVKSRVVASVCDDVKQEQVAVFDFALARFVVVNFGLSRVALVKLSTLRGL